jgi:predicted GNAT superfamily acetyltransferase
MTAITIQPLKTVDACRHFQEVERRVWQADPEDIMPIHVLITVVKNGGMMLGAYTPDGPPELAGLVGVALWWLGAGRRNGQQRVKVCSHMAGVLPEWQGRGIGLRLKLAQRDWVLQQGITDWVTWTYDPLYRPNAVLNLHRLGATCNTYYPNHYGAMTDALNAGAPSDRCQVDWDLNSVRVVERVARPEDTRGWRVARPEDAREWRVLPSMITESGFRGPVEVEVRLDGEPLAVPLPDDIAAVRRQDRELGLAWRFYIREVFEKAFAAGYNLVDCVQIAEQGWHYILETATSK